MLMTGPTGPPEGPSYLMDDSDCEGDWLAPLGFGASLKPFGGDVRRAVSAPAMHLEPASAEPGHAAAPAAPGWGGPSPFSAPLAIRATRRADAADFSSLESSQSFLGGSSYTDESAWMYQQQLQQQHQRGGLPLPHHSPHQQPHYGSMPAQLPAGPPCSCGAYAYAGYHQHAAPHSPLLMPQDALAAVELSAAFEERHPAPFGLGAMSAPAHGAQRWVPVRPQAVPVAHGGLPLPSPLELDLAMLDDVDVLQLADTLPALGGVGQRALVGSCPLPRLLEESFSGDGNTDGSDSTMHRSSGSGSGTSQEALGRAHSQTLSMGSAARALASSRSPRRAAPIAIPRHSAGPARASSLKQQHRLGRSLSSSNMAAAAALASSLPGSCASDRPVRFAARRSLAVTAAALRESSPGEGDDDEEDEADDEEEEEEEEEEEGSDSEGAQVGSHHQREGAAAPRPRGGAAAPAGQPLGSKKKHNPWSLEETRALVEGVRAVGVGKWADIKRLASGGTSQVLGPRTAVDLKDKWRNLTRVARLPRAALKQRLQRGPSEVPLEVMLLVKELLEAGQEG